MPERMRSDCKNQGTHPYLKLLVLSSLLYGVGARSGEIIGLKIDDSKSFLTRPHAFTLHNSTGRKFIFYLASEAAQRSRYELSQNSAEEISDGKSERYTIELPTAGQEAVRYSLRASKRYQIYWNQQANRWDLSELNPR